MSAEAFIVLCFVCVVAALFIGWLLSIGVSLKLPKREKFFNGQIVAYTDDNEEVRVGGIVGVSEEYIYIEVRDGQLTKRRRSQVAAFKPLKEKEK